MSKPTLPSAVSNVSLQRRQLFEAFNARDWRKVSVLAAQLLKYVANDADVHFVAGLAETELRRFGAAVRHLRDAVSLDPRRSEFSTNLARCLSLAGERDEAMAMANLARASEPLGPMTLNVLGSVYAALNAHDAALEALQKAAFLAPDNASIRYSLAASLIDNAALDEAASEIDACLSLNPHFWRAYLTRAHLKRQTPLTHHLVELQSLLDEQPASVEARAYLQLAMAKEREDLGDYVMAFEQLTRGKMAARESIKYSIKQDEALFAAIESANQSLSGSACHPSSEPIFVFGMPRTGTTLVERILSSHPDVCSAGELRDFGISLREAWGSSRPFGEAVADMEELGRIDWHRVGEIYLARARAAAGTGGTGARFVDKLPHNFLYAGFIAKTFPAAKLICLRRHPVDTCLANFRQLFSQKLPYYNYSFDLLDTGAYYIMFDRLMAHLKQAFPGRILEVSYEALVAQQASISRDMLRFCGLEWNDRCLNFEVNTLPVSTASAIQVRSKIYTDAICRWHNYRPQLAGLCALLEYAGISIE